LKIQVKAHSSRPLCWHFCWYRETKPFATNFDIPNEGIGADGPQERWLEHVDCRAAQPFEQWANEWLAKKVEKLKRGSLTAALRRRRPHVRIVSGAPFFPFPLRQHQNCRQSAPEHPSKERENSLLAKSGVTAASAVKRLGSLRVK